MDGQFAEKSWGKQQPTWYKPEWTEQAFNEGCSCLDQQEILKHLPTGLHFQKLNYLLSCILLKPKCLVENKDLAIKRQLSATCPEANPVHSAHLIPGLFTSEQICLNTNQNRFGG